MASVISITKLRREIKHELYMKVKKAMELAKWQKHVKPGKIFIKPNYMSDQVVPGQCTSPWVLEAVIKVVKEAMPYSKIIVGDADVATQRQVEKSFKNWGIDRLCKELGVGLVNLSKQPTVKANIKGSIFKEMHIPKVIMNADSIISVPVVKTHNVTKMSCALKNQWGCISRMRHRYHLVVDKCLADINSFLKIDFVVADATICLEDNGPRVGKPRIMNAILASSDRVALDCAVAKMMGIDPAKVGHIVHAHKRGVGSMEYEIKGAKLPNEKFLPAKIEKHPIVYMEMLLRKVPVLNYILFNTPVFKIPAYIASKYNTLWWYNIKGKKYAREIIKKSELYQQEFEKLIK